VTYFENNDCDWSGMTSYVIINMAQTISMVRDVEVISLLRMRVNLLFITWPYCVVVCNVCIYC